LIFPVSDDFPAVPTIVTGSSELTPPGVA
jgi:hypothetical protein